MIQQPESFCLWLSYDYSMSQLLLCSEHKLTHTLTVQKKTAEVFAYESDVVQIG